MSTPLVEPWLRGPIPGVDPLLAPVLRAFEHAHEDLARHTDGLTAEQIWALPQGVAPLGFQLKHIAGSTDRLVTYLEGRSLSGQQMADLRAEMEPGPSRDELLAQIGEVFARAEVVVRALDPAGLAEPRAVGRTQLPTTAAGLLTHIAEHIMRHVGQAIVTVKLVRV